MSDRPRRGTVLIHPGALGDLLQALPACGQVRAAFDEPLTLLTGDPFAEVARSTGLFDEVLSFDASAAYHGGTARRARVVAGAARALRARRPARVGVLKGSPAYAALAWMSGAPVRVGLARGQGARLLTAAVRLDGRVHREAQYAAVAAGLGAGDAAPHPVRWPDRLPAVAAPLAESGPWLAIAPGGARNVKGEMPARRWPAPRYAEVAAALREAVPGLRIVLMGSAVDRAETDAVLEALPPGAALDLVGRTSVPEARAVLARVDAFVCHDSALLHLAGSTGTPVVAIFGPTDPRVIAPRREGVCTLWHPVRATPCHDEVTGRMPPCAVDCCITRVTTADVVRTALPILERRGGSAK